MTKEQAILYINANPLRFGHVTIDHALAISQSQVDRSYYDPTLFAETEDQQGVNPPFVPAGGQRPADPRFIGQQGQMVGNYMGPDDPRIGADPRGPQVGRAWPADPRFPQGQLVPVGPALTREEAIRYIATHPADFGNVTEEQALLLLQNDPRFMPTLPMSREEAIRYINAHPNDFGGVPVDQALATMQSPTDQARFLVRGYGPLVDPRVSTRPSDFEPTRHVDPIDPPPVVVVKSSAPKGSK